MKVNKVSKALIWDDLADEYKKATGHTAYAKSMDGVFDWAKKQTDKFFVDPNEGTIHKIGGKMRWLKKKI